MDKNYPWKTSILLFNMSEMYAWYLYNIILSYDWNINTFKIIILSYYSSHIGIIKVEQQDMLIVLYDLNQIFETYY